MLISIPLKDPLTRVVAYIKGKIAPTDGSSSGSSSGFPRKSRLVFFAILIGISIFVGMLNIGSVHGFNTITKHQTYKERILRGFYVGEMDSDPTPPTFPMWGYGWILLISERKSVLIILNDVLALASVWVLIKSIEDTKALSRGAQVLLQLMIAVCLPWYAYHSFEWDQSPTTSLFVMSLCLLASGLLSQKTISRRLLASAGLLGLSLNFRSDFYLLPIIFAAIILAFEGLSRRGIVRAGVWFGIVYLTLVPWMIYTIHAVGVPLLTSTNGGHVLWIGLGQDPLNRFGVSYADGDPLMYRIIERELGPDAATRCYGSCSYEADVVLKREFLRTISKQPGDYLDLVVRKLRWILSGRFGTYDGEFTGVGNVGRFGLGLSFRYRLNEVTAYMGHKIQYLTTVFGLAALAGMLIKRQHLMALVLSAIVFQYLLNSIAVVMPQYLANLLLLQLLVIAAGLEAIVAALVYLGRQVARRTQGNRGHLPSP